MHSIIYMCPALFPLCLTLEVFQSVSLPLRAWDHETRFFPAFPLWRVNSIGNDFPWRRWTEKQAEFAVSISLASWCSWGEWQNKIMRKGAKTGRDGNGSRKTEVICLQPSQTPSQAEDGNEAIYSKSHIPLGGRGKRKQRGRQTTNWVCLGI